MSGAKHRAEPMPSNSAPLFSDALVAGIAARMKQVAAASGDHLFLSDGPVNPDWELLDLCADALHFAKVEESETEKWRNAQPSDPTACAVAGTARKAARAEVTQRLRRAGKIKAQTPAGIYAKAMLVRYSSEAATILAMSLAADLVECEALRLALWPAGGAA